MFIIDFQKRIILIVMLLVLAGNYETSFAATGNTTSGKIVKVEMKLSPQKTNSTLMLPSTVAVVLNNGKREVVNVTWLDQKIYKTPGTYTLRYNITKYKEFRKVNVTIVAQAQAKSVKTQANEKPLYLKVQSSESENLKDSEIRQEYLYYNAFQDDATFTEIGLPYIGVVYLDGSEGTVPCNWDAEDAKKQGIQIYKVGKGAYFKVEKPGVYTLKGKIAGYSKPITHKVNVIDNTYVGNNPKLLMALAKGFKLSWEEIKDYNLHEEKGVIAVIDDSFSFNGIENLNNLEILTITYVGGTNVQVDYEALKQCKKLKSLYLVDMPLSEIEKLPDLKRQGIAVYDDNAKPDTVAMNTANQETPAPVPTLASTDTQAQSLLSLTGTEENLGAPVQFKSEAFKAYYKKIFTFDAFVVTERIVDKTTFLSLEGPDTLEDLKYFKNLEQLSLDLQGKVIDLKPLEALKLKELSLANAPIEVVKQMPQGVQVGKLSLSTTTIEEFPESLLAINGIETLWAPSLFFLERGKLEALIDSGRVTPLEGRSLAAVNNEGLVCDYYTKYYNRLGKEEALRVAAELTTPEMTELEKVSRIYDYLTESAVYDYEAYNMMKNASVRLNFFPEADKTPLMVNSTYNMTVIKATTAYGPLIQKKAVCSGFSTAFYEIATAAGLTCERVSGFSKGGNIGHAWNMVMIDGQERYVDVTWDLKSARGDLPYQYFLKTSEEMAVDHTWDPNNLTGCN